MSKVVAIMSMSLDGYVADLNDGVAEVFDWYFTSGDVEIHTGGSDPMTFKMSGPSADHLRGLTSGLGAMLTGRRTFDVAQGWGGNHAWGPAFVLTHHVPPGWPRPNSTVHFVIDGIESAVNQAATRLVVRCLKPYPSSKRSQASFDRALRPRGSRCASAEYGWRRVGAPPDIRGLGEPPPAGPLVV